MKKIIIDQFILKLGEKLNVIIERKRKNEHYAEMDHFHDFPFPPEHYLLSLDRITFSLMVLCTENVIQVGLFLGENPQDYFLPEDGKGRVRKRKKVFSQNQCLQNNPSLLMFLKNKAETESWTTIQIPNHGISKQTITKVCFTVQDTLSLLSPKKERVVFEHA